MNSTLIEPGCLHEGSKRRPELAVLFHLMDVSRPRTAASPVKPAGQQAETPVTAEPAEIPVQPLVLPSNNLPSAGGPAAGSVPVNLLVEHQLPLHSFASIDLSATAGPKTGGSEFIAVPADVTASSTSDIESSAPKTEVAEKPQPAKPVQEVAPASPVASRLKAKTAASEDWFASHGKYLAIAFVLALIGTVYFARANRGTVAPAHAGLHSHPPVVDLKIENRESASADVAATESAAKSVQAVSAVSDSKVELHPPAVSQIAASPSAEGKSHGSDKLFEFPSPKKSDERVAARPEGGTAAEGPVASQKSASQIVTELKSTAAAPAAASTAPALSPSYPTTTPAPGGYPTSSPGAGGYPTTSSSPGGYPQTSAPPLVGATVTPVAPPPMAPPGAPYGAVPQGAPSPPPNYRSQFPAPAGPYPPQAAPYQPYPQGWTPPPQGAVPPGQYQPPQTAHGPRNERIGSGHF